MGRLLIATDFPPDAYGGGAAVVRQMLDGFPGQIHWWSARGSTLGPNRQKIGKISSRLDIYSHTHASPGLFFPQRRFARLRALFMEVIWTRLASVNLAKTLKAVQPSHIWLIPHDWSIGPLYRSLVTGEPASIGARVHVTIQDFPDVHSHAERWGGRIVQRMARRQEEIYRRAGSRDATSFPMLEELRSRTGCAGEQMLHAGLEPEDFAYLDQPARARSLSQPVRIAYAGTILVEEDFRIMVGRLHTIRRLLPSGLTLDFWSAHSYRGRSWFDPSWMNEHGHATESELQQKLRSCDWGFSLMALEERDPRYNRFSFPTKFITYLSAGLPILGFGHPRSSLIRLMGTYGAGYSVQNIQHLESDNLLEILANPDAKTLYRPEIQRCAHECFDATRMRIRLWNSLTDQGS